MNTTDQRALVPVQYVGKKPEKIDNVADTGLAWLPGQIHFVPPLTAQKLARYPDIWKIVDDATVEADPAAVGLVVTETQLDPPALTQIDLQAKTLDLPNLAGMVRADISTFAASQFNVQLPANMKKEDMIQQVVALSNSKAAGEIE